MLIMLDGTENKARLGANAILALAHHAIAISAVARPEEGTTVNVGVVRGGTLPYVVPAEA